MSPKEGVLERMTMSAVVVLLSLGGIVWDVGSGLLFSGIDGIMLLAVCLMMGGVFSLMMLNVARSAGLLGSIKRFGRKRAEAPAAASAASPASSSPSSAASSSPSSSMDPPAASR